MSQISGSRTIISARPTRVKTNTTEATAEFEKAIQLAPESFFHITALARLFVRTGDHKKAYEIVRELESRRNERFVPLGQLAAIYNGFGNKDRALDLLEKAVAERELPRLTSREQPLFDNLRSEPRFQNILKRMNVDN